MIHSVWAVLGLFGLGLLIFWIVGLYEIVLALLVIAGIAWLILKILDLIEAIIRRIFGRFPEELMAKILAGTIIFLILSANFIQLGYATVSQVLGW